jgi:hypothetical protein
VPDGFRGFVMTRSPTLLRTAWLLAGDEATAQDLVQTALMKSWPRCDRLDHGGPRGLRPTRHGVDVPHLAASPLAWRTARSRTPRPCRTPRCLS